LEDLADAAEESSRELRGVANTARDLDRQRRNGVPWSTMVSTKAAQRLFDRLAGSARRMAGATSRLRHSVIEALGQEGLSTRQIAKVMGVTHQRISAMRNHGGRNGQ
jgi:hypothetical protein